MQFTLEVCVDSVASVVNAQAAGAHRIELCSNLTEGGTTPGPGLISSARSNLDIKINVLVRPRGGDFLYSGLEYDMMRRDIEHCGEAGADGVVIGILNAVGEIDFERTARLIELARPMSVTFHRAFDMCRNPTEGLEDVIKAGADRLLTSGQKNSAAEGSSLIASLVKKAGSKLAIMPGSGLNESNIAEVARITGAGEFHLTGRTKVEGGMIYRKEGISMGKLPGYDEYSLQITDINRIRKITEILKMI